MSNPLAFCVLILLLLSLIPTIYYILREILIERSRATTVSFYIAMSMYAIILLLAGIGLYQEFAG